MAQGATVMSFTINLSDVDRSVYETLDLKVARHASETLDYLVMRVLAYCLEHGEGISFSKGLGEGDEPAVWRHDLTGRLVAWIEVGAPDPERLHRASKACERVAIYAHKGAELVKQRCEGARIHRAAEIPIYEVDQAFQGGLVATVDRRNVWDLSVTDRHLYASTGDRTLETPLVEHRLA